LVVDDLNDGTAMLPAWAQLLRQYRMEGRFGLTLSFLLGAMRRPPGAVVAEDISIREFRFVLESMRDQFVDCRVRILKCIWLQQPVVALDNQESIDEVPISASSDGDPQLYVSQKYLVGGPPDLETVFTNLWDTFRQPINEGRFSYLVDDESFQPFTANDLAFIQGALGKG
jgi:hypothetical protein